jgi:SAM-dependent methyltransferase
MRSDIPKFTERYQHAHNKIQWHIPAELRSGKFLDIGCGTGNGVVAALKHGASIAVGVDRSFREFAHDFDPSEFPSICEHFGVEHSKSLLLEGSIFDFSLEYGAFDYAMMLDSIEHLPDPRSFVNYAYSSLRKGGAFIIDTCPLYYSPGGHHLWHYFPQAELPWAHLRKDFKQRLSAVDKWSLDRFHELNKVTHDHVIGFFTDAGFEIELEHRSNGNDEMRAALERFRPELVLDGIPENILLEDWILVVGRK